MSFSTVEIYMIRYINTYKSQEIEKEEQNQRIIKLDHNYSNQNSVRSPPTDYSTDSCAAPGEENYFG
jgi:hypothetical protein